MNSQSNSSLAVDIVKACSYVAEHHADEKRNDNKTPFINHILEVVNFLISNDVTDRDVIIASILHDSLNRETAEEIPKLFGETVLKYVKECAVDSSLNTVERKQYLLQHANSMSPQVKLIYLGDLYSNVNFLSNHKPEKWYDGMIKGYIYWARKMCSYLAGINKQMDAKLCESFKKHTCIDHRLSTLDLDHHVEVYFEILKDRYNVSSCYDPI